MRFCTVHFRLLSSSCVSASAVSVCCPISVVKTRIEGSSVRPYRSLLHGLTSIYKTEGMKGLYTGLLPSVLKDSPYAAVYLLLYSNLKQMVTPSVLAWTGGDLSQKDSKKESPVVQFIAAFTAGGIATTFFHPSEVIKTRLQLMKLQEIAHAAAVTATTTTTATASASAQAMVPALPRHRVLFIARIILQENGVKGFFRGLLPRVMKRSLSNALGWMTYEQLVQMWTGVAAGL